MLATIREALAGSQRDLTEGDPGRAIVLLAIPMILEMLMESLFGIVDMFFVARLGVDSLATVALTESILVLVFGIAMGLSTATTAFVARRIGEKDPEGAAISAMQAIALGIVLAIVVGVAGIFYAPGLLSLMGATPSVVQTGATYTRILLGGSVTIFLLFLINAIFRGAGDAALAIACPLDREPDQHRARSLSHQWLGTVPAPESPGRRGRDHDRAGNRSGFSALDPFRRLQPHPHSLPPDPHSRESHVAAC